jgi:eukaryotic-like serine/threonine-protein kinase
VLQLVPNVLDDVGSRSDVDMSGDERGPVSSPRTFKAAGEAVRLTAGTAFEWQPSVAALPTGGRRMAFASLTENSEIWTLPVAADEARPTGLPQRLTDSAAQDHTPTLSADGRRLAYVSNRTGFSQIWLRDLETGSETAVTSNTATKFGPILSPDGSLLTYSDSETGTWPIYLVRLESGEERILEVSGLANSFTPDGGSIFFHDVPGRVSILDLASGRSTLLLDKPGHRFVEQRLAPDGRWLAFSALSRGRGRIVVAPYRRPAPIDEKDWIEVTDGRSWDVGSSWSAGGNVIYFDSDRDGYMCLWAQRLDPVTKRASGPPVAIRHEHSPSRSMPNSAFYLAGDRLVLTMVERTGSIWMAEWKAR